MATQTRRTTRRLARFFRATVNASVVTACGGLLLLNAVAADASQSWNGMPFNGLPYNGMPFNGMPYNGTPYNGLYVNGLAANSLACNGMPFNGLPFNGLESNGILINGMPFNGMPRQGMPIQGMPMNGTPLQGLPPQEGSLPTAQRDHLPWSTLSHRAIGEVTVPAMHDRHDTLPVELPTVR